MAEATAMRNGIKAVAKAGFTNIHIEGDSRILIQAVKRQIQVPWAIQVLVQDINYFLERFNNVVVYHIFRQGNSAADWLAKFGLTIHSTNVWNLVSHGDLGRILFEDNLGRALEKRVSNLSLKKKKNLLVTF